MRLTPIKLKPLREELWSKDFRLLFSKMYDHKRYEAFASLHRDLWFSIGEFRTPIIETLLDE